VRNWEEVDLFWIFSGSGEPHGRIDESLTAMPSATKHLFNRESKGDPDLVVGTKINEGTRNG
jgi:hypothetical protein